MTCDLLRTPDAPPTSWSLLGLAVQNSNEAWTTIAKVYSPLVYSWGRKCGLHDSDASDITQKAFLKIYLNLENCDKHRGKFRGWLWAITRNLLTDHFRDQKRHRQLLEQNQRELTLRYLESNPKDADPDHIPNEVLRRALEAIRPKFKERTFQAGWRIVALGLDPLDVARGLGLSVGAAYIAKSRLLKELRAAMAGLECL